MSDDRRQTDRRVNNDIDIDWLLILLGPYDASKGCRSGGLIDKVSDIAEYVSLSRRIDSWTLRGIAAIAIIKFLGVDSIGDILKLIGAMH